MTPIFSSCWCESCCMDYFSLHPTQCSTCYAESDCEKQMESLQKHPNCQEGNIKWAHRNLNRFCLTFSLSFFLLPWHFSLIWLFISLLHPYRTTSCICPDCCNEYFSSHPSLCEACYTQRCNNHTSHHSPSSLPSPSSPPLPHLTKECLSNNTQ